ncbi:MAG: integrase family protein, partial [Pseudomonadales bacterium]|nr:integrase family protein [Pseudomonadales bacterium]
MRAKITAQFVKDLINGKIADFTTFPPTKETEIRDTELAGFALIAFPSSTVSFIFRYRNAEGKARKLTIGKYGKNMTVPAARQEAESRSPVAKSGVDVHSQKKEARRRAERVRQQTLGVFFEERYQPYCQAHMKSETANNRAWVIKHYFVEHWADRPLTEINQWLVTSWRRKKLKDGLKPGGVNRPIAALKALLNRAVEWQVIDVNPLAGMKQLKEDRTGVVRYLSEDEENRLRAALDKRQDQQRNERESHIQWQEERHLKAALSLTKAVFTDHIKPIVLLALNTGMRR